MPARHGHPLLDPHTMQKVRARLADPVPKARPMTPVPPADNRDLDTYYWRGPGAEFQRRGDFRNRDDQLFPVSTVESDPTSEPPNISLFVTESCPPWNCPPFWSDPFEFDFELCLPTYEQWYTIGTFRVPEMRMAVVEQVSYDFTAGLSQYELFEYQILASSRPLVTVEDMFIDPTTGDPSHKYVFAGDTKPMPIETFVDRDRILSVRARVRGLVDLNGNSNQLPGNPINPNAHIRFTVIGYTAPFRHNVDGAPRHQDLGNMGFYDLDGSEVSREGL